MTALTWDKVGERFYQTGVDRGVLYLQDGTAVSWNGLIGVEESSDSELKSYYLDGVKFLENVSPGDFQGKLKAFTYPDEFDLLNGIASPAEGLFFHEQPPKSFNLSYRTRIGNDIKGTEHGYRIHILYNLVAVPDSQSYETLQDTAVPIEFSWSLTGIPPRIKKFRPTVHISMDSTKTDCEVWKTLEDTLYGTCDSPPTLLSIEDIGELFGYRGALIIVDHGDGTWSAIDEGDAYIHMIDATTFKISHVDGLYLDAVTYEISSTNE